MTEPCPPEALAAVVPAMIEPCPPEAPATVVPTADGAQTASSSKNGSAATDVHECRAGGQAKGAPVKESDKNDAKEKQITLAKALMKKENKDTASVLAFFMFALALVPVGSLLICEASFRQVIPDDNRRWMISGAVAVALVNLLIFAYVAWCFYEGFQHEWGARPASAAGTTVVESS